MAGKVWLCPSSPWGPAIMRSGLSVAGRDGLPEEGDAVLSGISVSGVNLHSTLYEGKAWVLNREAATFAVMSEMERDIRLVRAGLRSSRQIQVKQEQAAARRFRIPVFQLESLRVEVLGKVRFGAASDLRAEHPLYRTLSRAAVKAAYASGLDMAVVDVGVLEDQRIYVESVRVPQFASGQGGAEGGDGLWAEAFRRFARGYGMACADEGRQIAIGADPEFVMIRPDGRIASAERYFPQRGETGCDAVRTGGRVRYPLAELRPAPAAGPAELVRRLQLLLQRAAAAAGDPALRWLAGGMPVPGLPLGGHIHLSGVWLSSRLLRALDSFAALPLAMAEDPRGKGRRPRYGALGDFRLQPHGGFEYRTLPSWLVSPAAARAAIALAMFAAKELWRLGPQPFPAEREEIARAYYAGDRSTLVQSLDELQGRMQQSGSYEENAVNIEPLFEAIRSGKTWDESADIRSKWGIKRQTFNPQPAPGAALRP